MMKTKGKRKERSDDGDDEAQRITVKRPALPLNTTSAGTQVDSHCGSVSPAAIK
jgi:hypothetical protein